MLIINSAKLYNPEGEERLVAIHINDGKIVNISEVVEQDTSNNIIDLGGAYVTAGLIESSCSIGVIEQIYRFEGDDGDEIGNPVIPGVRALDAIDPLDEGFEMALRAGVTTVVTGPGDANVIGGTFAAMKTAGKTLDEMIIVPEIAMKFVFGYTPKEVYGHLGKMPSTRMGIGYLIRDSLINAREYKRLKDLAMEKMIVP